MEKSKLNLIIWFPYNAKLSVAGYAAAFSGWFSLAFVSPFDFAQGKLVS